MIRKLSVEGITVFPERESFHFVPGLNIIVGGNDSGKSHLMKLSYALCLWGMGSSRRELPENWAEEKRLRQVLLRVFGTQDLTSLASRQPAPSYAWVHASLEGQQIPLGAAEIEFSFQSSQEEDGIHLITLPQRYLIDKAIFLSPREVLSLYPCYMQAGKRYPELLDAASWELCRALEKEPTAPLRDGALQHVLQCIERLLSGHLSHRNGRFYLKRPGQEPFELNLVAEGFKRIGILGLLLGNGSLQAGSTLFWDEPEMNLNTNHLPLLVNILTGLCRARIQLILTTHSLFLLRELVIQLATPRNRHIPRRYFGLQVPGARVTGTRITTGDTLSQITPPESLLAEIEQADRYLQMNPDES